LIAAVFRQTVVKRTRCRSVVATFRTWPSATSHSAVGAVSRCCTAPRRPHLGTFVQITPAVTTGRRGCSARPSSLAFVRCSSSCSTRIAAHSSRSYFRACTARHCVFLHGHISIERTNSPLPCPPGHARRTPIAIRLFHLQEQRTNFLLYSLT
jgi:hypothetical protein